MKAFIFAFFITTQSPRRRVTGFWVYIIFRVRCR